LNKEDVKTSLKVKSTFQKALKRRFSASVTSQVGVAPFDRKTLCKFFSKLLYCCFHLKLRGFKSWLGISFGHYQIGQAILGENDLYSFYKVSKFLPCHFRYKNP